MFSYFQSIIFYVVKSQKLKEWLENQEIFNSLSHTKAHKFADLDPTFHLKIDEDFDFKESGITRSSFCNVYHNWIVYCVARREDYNNIDTSRDSMLISLCFALGLLGKF